MDDRKHLNEIKPVEKGHTVSIDNRKKVKLSGIVNVDSFNELEIILETEMGLLTVKGNSLHVSKLNIDTGELYIDGNVDSCVYSEKQDLKTKSEGFFGKIFK